MVSGLFSRHSNVILRKSEGHDGKQDVALNPKTKYMTSEEHNGLTRVRYSKVLPWKTFTTFHLLDATVIYRESISSNASLVSEKSLKFQDKFEEGKLCLERVQCSKNSSKMNSQQGEHHPAHCNNITVRSTF